MKILFIYACDSVLDPHFNLKYKFFTEIWKYLIFLPTVWFFKSENALKHQIEKCCKSVWEKVLYSTLISRGKGTHLWKATRKKIYFFLFYSVSAIALQSRQRCIPVKYKHISHTCFNSVTQTQWQMTMTNLHNLISICISLQALTVHEKVC